MALLNSTISPAITRLAAEQAAELQHAEAAHVIILFLSSFLLRVLPKLPSRTCALLQVFAVLKHTLEKLALVGVITVDPKVQAQELTQSVGEEITRMIAQQKRLEQRFEELVSAQHALRDLPNKSKLRENQVGQNPPCTM